VYHDPRHNGYTRASLRAHFDGLIFLGFGTLIGYQIDGIRSGLVSLDIAQRDEVMERSPLPYPLARCGLPKVRHGRPRSSTPVARPQDWLLVGCGMTALGLFWVSDIFGALSSVRQRMPPISIQKLVGGDELEAIAAACPVFP